MNLDPTLIIVAAIAAIPPSIIAFAAWRTASGNAVKADAAKDAALVAKNAAELAKDRASVAVDVAKASNDLLVKVDGAVYELGQRVDGRLEKLLENTEKMARAQGTANGILQEQERVKNAADKVVALESHAALEGEHGEHDHPAETNDG